MLVDYTKIYVKSGDGGNGAITFRRENMLQQADQMAVTEEKVETFTLLLIQIPIH